MDVISILREFGAYGLWGVILYKVLNIVEVVVAFLLIGWGIKRALNAVKDR